MLRSLGHWSSSWGARESNRSVDMGLIGSAIRKWNLAFCHEVASRGPGRLMLGHACETLAVMYLQRGPPIVENQSTTHRTHRTHRQRNG